MKISMGEGEGVMSKGTTLCSFCFNMRFLLVKIIGQKFLLEILVQNLLHLKKVPCVFPGLRKIERKHIYFSSKETFFLRISIYNLKKLFTKSLGIKKCWKNYFQHLLKIFNNHRTFVEAIFEKWYFLISHYQFCAFWMIISQKNIKS